MNDIIDPNLPMYAVAVGGEKHKDVGCLCCAAGPLEMRGNIDRSCYCPGESILINASIQNQTTRDMTSMYAKLVQTITYRASNKSKTVSKEVARVEGPMIPQHQDASWNNQPLGIPAIPPSIINSSVITINYTLKLCVAVPWGINPEVNMPVTMGTVPYTKVYGQPLQYDSPIQPQPPEANFIGGPSYQPVMPSVFGYPDMPPPSYSAAVGQTGVHIGNDKDKYTHGVLQYNPVYTFAQPYQGTYSNPYQGNYSNPASAPPQEYGMNPPPYSSIEPK